ISPDIGMPGVFCYLENLRDRYIKERKKVREKKSGAGAEQKITWKYFTIMSFLEPYVRERATSSNMSPSSQNRPSSPQATSAPLPASSSGTPSDETFSLYLTEVIPTTQTTSSPLAELAPEPLFLAPAVSQEPGPSTCTSRASPAPCTRQGSRQGMKRQREELENKILKVLEQSTDEDELFLLSIAPRLRNLPPERRSEAKLEFMTSLHRAEFSK
uniref:BESS domain-containing protein n=1 Tax=Paramormyrops kingsleyae TaxID=1676925 RepID=A0A3B3RYR3_9TELE